LLHSNVCWHGADGVGARQRRILAAEVDALPRRPARPLGRAVGVGLAVLALLVDALLVEVDVAVLVLLAGRVDRRLASGAAERDEAETESEQVGLKAGEHGAHEGATPGAVFLGPKGQGTYWPKGRETILRGRIWPRRAGERTS
jgi:hypothetical protein